MARISQTVTAPQLGATAMAVVSRQSGDMDLNAADTAAVHWLALRPVQNLAGVFEDIPGDQAGPVECTGEGLLQA